MKGTFEITIKSFVLLAVALLISIRANAENRLSDQLRKDIKAIEKFYNKRLIYDTQKKNRIAKINHELGALIGSNELEKQYAIHKKLYKEYYSYKNNEAYQIAQFMYKVALQLHSEEKKNEALLYQADILLCSGYFNETFEVLKLTTHFDGGDLKVLYYKIMTRLYGDLKSYNNLTYFSHQYEKLNHAYADSLLNVADYSSVEYQMVSAMKLTDEGKTAEALKQCVTFLDEEVISEHHKAMLYSNMAWIAMHMDNHDAQIQFLLKSIQSDIKSSTYETTSSRVLAKILLENDEIELAHKFVLRAISDAEAYGAHQRKAQVTKMVPIIEKQLKKIQQLKMNSLIGISVIILISLLAILYLLVRLKKRHNQVKAGNHTISEQNRLLFIQNKQLLESNKIKEEYLTSYFELSTVYYHDIEKIRDKVGSLLLQKKYSAISLYLGKGAVLMDKDDLWARFDKLFVSLFPTFIQDMNRICNDSDQIHEINQEHLSAELRVFALFRLGIVSADRVASILGISKNTVYSYRNRIKSRVNMLPEEFDEYILNIPAY